MTSRNSNSHTQTNKVRLFLTGVAMGTADLIPGVSGGTIAFLFGIYDELLTSIKTVSGPFLSTLIKGHVKAAFALVPWRFLIPLLTGIFGAIFSLARLLSYLLDVYPAFVWAFFFGLVLASTWIVLKRVKKWSKALAIGFAIATVVTYFLVGAIPIETPKTLFVAFWSGAIAICAMILPGISGSFILLLLGQYQHILDSVVSKDFVTLAVFATGCALGLSLFARFLTWLFKHHHDISVAVLAGIMLGSIRKIWPWKETISTRLNSHGELVPFIEKNIWPNSLDPTVLVIGGLIVAGILAVWYLEKLQVTNEHHHDI